ncbi:MmcQ/YjbR family DNA-binding protein [Lacrimispora brassicae]
MRYHWIDEYLKSMKGVSSDFKEEWNWTRYLLGDKMFVAVCRDDQGREQLITLKLEPAEGEFLRQQYEDILPGYYMNKVHWNSIKADGNVPDDLVKDLLEKSYYLVLTGLTKKKQKELLGENILEKA